MKALPKVYKRPYFINPIDKDYCRVILYLITPSGKISKFYQSYLIKDLGINSINVVEFPEYAKEQCIEVAKVVYKSELKKGYKIGEVFLLSAKIKGEYL